MGNKDLARSHEGEDVLVLSGKSAVVCDGVRHPGNLSGDLEGELLFDALDAGWLDSRTVASCRV